MILKNQFSRDISACYLLTRHLQKNGMCILDYFLVRVKCLYYLLITSKEDIQTPKVYELILLCTYITCRAESKATSNNSRHLAPVLRKPRNRKHHGHKIQECHGGWAQHAIGNVKDFYIGIGYETNICSDRSKAEHDWPKEQNHPWSKEGYQHQTT